jgi:phosphoglycolate phosphatase
MFTVQKILFDLDGTLVDTAADLHAATNHTLQSIGRAEVTLSQVRHMTGYGAVKLIEQGLEETGGLEGLNMEDLRQTFLAYYSRNICVHSALYDGCTQMLSDLKEQGFQLAVCTNKPYAMAKTLLTDIGIAPFFSALTGGDSFTFRKPDGRHLNHTAAMLTGTGQVLMVGDSAPDIMAAKDAGMPVIAVDFGYADGPIAPMKPSKIISSLAEVPALVALQGS